MIECKDSCGDGSSRYRLKISEDEVFFGTILVGNASPAFEIILENVGWEDILFQSLSITGPFTLVRTNCPDVLKPGQKGRIAVTFTPTAFGPWTGAVFIMAGRAGDHNIRLVGAAYNSTENGDDLSGIPIFLTREDLEDDTNLVYPNGTYALVMSDEVLANNDFYRKTGDSGEGDWGEPLGKLSTIILNGQIDLENFDNIVNGAADRPNPGHPAGTVTMRDGETYKTLAKILGEQQTQEEIASEYAILAGQYANNNTDVPIAGASDISFRGAKWWSTKAQEFALLASTAVATVATFTNFFKSLGSEVGENGLRWRIGKRLLLTADAVNGVYPRKLTIPKTAKIDDDVTISITDRMPKTITEMLDTWYRVRIGKRLLFKFSKTEGFFPSRATLPANQTWLSDDTTKTLAQRINSGAPTDLTRAIYWGDSRTAGAGEGTPNRFPEYLVSLITTNINNAAITHTNRGIGGQTSIMIASRQGGEPLRLSVTGNQIPASGPVAVTAYSTDIFSSSGTAFAAGSHIGALAGVPGTFASNGTGAGGLTFTRTTNGSAINIQPYSPFLIDFSVSALNAINFICIGTNGAGTNVINGKVGDMYETTRLAKAMLELILKSGGLPIVASVIGRNPNIPPTTQEITDNTLLNNMLKVACGRYYIDFLVPPTDAEITIANAAGLGGTPIVMPLAGNDLTDRNAGLWPRSFYGDTVHFNRYAQYIQALRVKRHLVTFGIIK